MPDPTRSRNAAQHWRRENKGSSGTLRFSHFQRDTQAITEKIARLLQQKWHFTRQPQAMHPLFTVLLGRITARFFGTNGAPFSPSYCTMNTDEKAIMDYLKAWPRTFVSGREIAKRVGGKRRYAEDRSWAFPILVEMVKKGWLETDAMNYYRLQDQDRKKKAKSINRHVSPQILRILKTSGKKFDGIAIDPETDETPASDQSEPSGNGAT
jgi:hypothetical protein